MSSNVSSSLSTRFVSFNARQFVLATSLHGHPAKNPANDPMHHDRPEHTRLPHHPLGHPLASTNWHCLTRPPNPPSSSDEPAAATLENPSPSDIPVTSLSRPNWHPSRASNTNPLRSKPPSAIRVIHYTNRSIPSTPAPRPKRTTVPASVRPSRDSPLAPQAPKKPTPPNRSRLGSARP
jgi:hypothetical protein